MGKSAERSGGRHYRSVVQLSVIGVPASLATPGDSSILLRSLAPSAGRAVTQRRACEWKRYPKGWWEDANRRRTPLRQFWAPRAETCADVRRRREGQLWVRYGNGPSQRAPQSVSSGGPPQYGPVRECRRRCLSLASATAVAARDVAAVFSMVWGSQEDRSCLPPSPAGRGHLSTS